MVDILPRDHDYVDLRMKKIAPLLRPLRSGNVSDRVAAERLHVGVGQYRDWETGKAVPPVSARVGLSQAIYDWSAPKEAFVQTWKSLSGLWGWAPIAEAEGTYHELADSQVPRPELRDLTSDWDSVLASHTARIRFIDGDHGEGKTTLARLFLADAVRGNPDAIVAATTCPEITVGEGYAVVSEILTQVVQQVVGPSVQEKNASLRLRDMLDKAPAWRVAILQGYEAAARPCVNRERQSSVRPPTVRDSQKQLQYFELVFMAARRPIIIFIDNIQWADDSSLGALLYLVRASGKNQIPVYVVTAHRHFEAHLPKSDDAPFSRFLGEALKEPHTRILRFKEGVGVEEYLAKRYPGQQFPREIIELVQMATRGNPYLLTNVLHELDSLGKPQRLSKEPFARLMQDWQNGLHSLLSRASPLLPQDDLLAATMLQLRQKIGDTLLSMRLSRMDRDSLKMVLKQAAVEWKVGGEAFSVEVVTQACSIAEPYVYLELADLENKYQLIRARPQSPAEASRLTLYEFWYWLYGSYIYDMVPPAQQPKLHLKVAECISVLYGENPSVARILAEHYSRANLPQKAAAYALEAAKYEAARSAWAEVESHCRKGIRWLEAIPGSEAARIRVGLLHVLGDGYYRNGDYNSASEAFNQALEETGPARSEPDLVVRLCAYLSETEEARGQYPDARRALRKGQDVIREYLLPVSEATLWLTAMKGLLLSRADKTKKL